MTASPWKRLRRRVKGAVPARPYYLATTAARTLQHLPGDLRYRRTARSQLAAPFPPPYLRYRVSGTYDVAGFHTSGAEARDAIDTALTGVGTSLAERESVLDFGVGCGRIMRWLAPLAPATFLAGSDIDRAAVRWCKRRLDFATFVTNDGLPPLEFAADTFDLVYSHSVFTHLDVDYQRAWLEELRRVLRPGGLALLTIHGDGACAAAVEHLRRSDADAADAMTAGLAAEGFFFNTNSQWRGVFPDFYHNAYQTGEYTRREWHQVMDVLDVLPGGMRGSQDLVVLRNP